MPSSLSFSQTACSLLSNCISHLFGWQISVLAADDFGACAARLRFVDIGLVREKELAHKVVLRRS